MILKDRINNIYQNYSVCDENCKYKKIDLNKKMISCQCSIKKKVDAIIAPLRFDHILLDLFTNSSFGVVKCYKLVFDFRIKLNNIGFWIFTLLVLIHIPFIIHYCRFGIRPIGKYIINEMKKFNYYKDILNPNKRKKKRKKFKLNNDIYRIKFINLGTDYKNPNINNNVDNPILMNENKNKNIEIPVLYKNEKLNKTSSRDLSITNKYILKMNDYSKFENINRNKISIFKKTIKEEKKKNKINEKNLEKQYFLIQINADNSTDNKPPESKILLDNYDYENALKYENRKFSRIYYICLISKENILNLVYLKSPLELMSIRLIICMFIYSSDLALNTVFYFNEKISEKYNYNGDNIYLFTIFNNIFISLLSAFISFCLVNSLQYLTNCKDGVEKLFREEERKMRQDNKYSVCKRQKDEILINIYKIYKKLKIKIVIFLILEFFLMLFYYYFVTAFCEVYKETQISWILDSFVSFILSFPIEFFNACIIALLYVISLKAKLKWLYQIAMVFYNLG